MTKKIICLLALLSVVGCSSTGHQGAVKRSFASRPDDISEADIERIERRGEEQNEAASVKKLPSSELKKYLSEEIKKPGNYVGNWLQTSSAEKAKSDGKWGGYSSKFNLAYAGTSLFIERSEHTKTSQYLMVFTERQGHTGGYDEEPVIFAVTVGEDGYPVSYRLMNLLEK